MTTLTILDNGFVQLPPSILQLFGLKKGDTLEVNTSPKHLIIEPKDVLPKKNEDFALDEETKSLIQRTGGMIKVDIDNYTDDFDTAILAHHFYDEKDFR